MNDITVEELKSRMDQGEDLILIDVREFYEYEEFNLGGLLIPLGNLMANIPQLEPYREKEIIVHCRSGVRSGAAKEVLQQLGFSHVRNLLGGVLEWKEKFPS